MKDTQVGTMKTQGNRKSMFLSKFLIN